MDRSQRLLDLFNRACEEPPEERDGFVVRECGDDAAMLAEVRALLTADAEAEHESFWSKSAIAHTVAADAALAGAAAGSRLGHYRLTALIGSGGMGTVYKAVRDDREFDQVVAVKILKPSLDADRIAARLKTERQILATLDHPNIARLIDGGSDAEGLPYLVMEYVDGVPPLEYCERHGLSIADRIRLFLPICSAVHYAHQRMVIHRDVKPGNILIAADGTPKLLDFGIATLLEPDGHARASTLTADSGAMLTVHYASPEQITGEAITTSSDLYSLGVCLYELLTGGSPYPNTDRPVPALLRAVCDEDPVAPRARVPALRGDLDNILLKTLQKHPRQRYASVDQLAEDLRRYLAGLPVLARGDGAVYVMAKFVRRHTMLVAVAVLLIASLAGGLIATRRAQARADRRFADVRRLARSVVFDYHDAIQGLPGSTPVRERLVRDALAYLDSLSAEASDPELQREVIDAYVRISNVQGNSYYDHLGDTAGAQASARKAVTLADALLVEQDDAASRRSAARAYDAEGGLLFSSGRLTEAESRFRRSLELFESAAAGGGDPDLALDHATAMSHLADLYGSPGVQNLGRTSEAITLYRHANSLIEQAAAARPADSEIRHRRYQMVLQLAAMDAAQGRTAEAARGFQSALTLAEATSAARPDNALDKQEISNIALRLGMLLMDDGRFVEALPHVDRSLSIMTGLSAADPRNALFKRNTSVIENHYARALVGAGRPGDALRHNDSSLNIALALSKGDDKSAELRGDVAISRRRRAETLVALKRFADAITDASEAVTVLTQLADASGDASFRAQSGRALRVLAEARLGAGDVAGARLAAARAEAVTLALTEADPANAIFKADLELARSTRAKTEHR